MSFSQSQIQNNTLFQLSNDDIGFELNSNQKVLKTVLKVKNICNKDIYYKIKSSDPNSFMIKPNKGTIYEQQEVSLEIDFNSQTLQFTPNFKYQLLKDKFMIQGIQIDNLQDEQDMESILKDQKDQKNYNIQSSKLKIYVYEEGFDIKQSLFAKAHSKRDTDQESGQFQINSYADSFDHNIYGENFKERYQQVNIKFVELTEELKKIQKERDQIYKKQSNLKIQPKQNRKFIYLLMLFLIFFISIATFKIEEEKYFQIKLQEELIYKEQILKEKQKLEDQKKKAKKNKNCQC